METCVTGNFCLCQSQIWDFHLGRSRICKETSPEAGYEVNNSGFVIKNYSEITKGSSLTTKKVLQDMYEMNCTTYEDMLSKNVSHSDFYVIYD